MGHAPLDKNVVAETVPAPQIAQDANVEMMVAEEIPVDLVPMVKHVRMVFVLEQEEKPVEPESVVMIELADPAVLVQQVKDVEGEFANAFMIVMKETVVQQLWMLDLPVPPKRVVLAPQALLAVPQDNVRHSHLVMLILLLWIGFQM